MDKRQAQLDGYFASQVWSEEELAVLAQTPASEKLARLEEFCLGVKKVLQGKSILKDAHEDLAKLQKSLQIAQDVAKIFKNWSKPRSVTDLEVRKGLRDKQRRKSHLEELQFLKGCRKPSAA